jgi:hypothetical protein
VEGRRRLLERRTFDETPGGSLSDTQGTPVAASAPKLVLELIGGGLFCQVVVASAVGLPAFAAIMYSERTGAPPSTSLIAVLAASAFGVAICAMVGSWLGGQPGRTWAFVAGYGLVNLSLLKYVLPPWTGLDATGVSLTVILASFIVGAAALILGFWFGRARRRRRGDHVAIEQ